MASAAFISRPLMRTVRSGEDCTLARSKAEGAGAKQAWIDFLPDGKVPTLAGSTPL